MATYSEVKSLICRILCGKNIDENNENKEEDIVVDLQRYHRYSLLQGGKRNKQIVITNTDLQDLYNKVCRMNKNGLQLYTDYNFEVAIELDSFIARHQESPMGAEDAVNNIRYELSTPTAEYWFSVVCSG